MMTTLRSILWLGTALFLLSPPPGQAQSTTADYELLWEITGNGLSQPSYLFGSMHSQESSIFKLPDSLWLALAACEGLANEIHLDSAMLLMVEKMVANDGPQSETVEEEPAAAFSAGDSLRAAALEDMPTVLDAYLMQHAKLWGKQLWGLENIEENLAQLEEDDLDLDMGRLFRQSAEFKEMESIYRVGSLEAVERYVQSNKVKFEADIELTRRNRIQANSIARIIREQSLFSVVGVAHLPGPQGVLQLLRDRGFRLRPVKATYGAKPANLPDIYQPAENWGAYRNQGASYRFRTPQKPIAMDMGIGQEGYLTLDLGTGTFYVLFEFIPDSDKLWDFASYGEQIVQRFLSEEYQLLERREEDYRGQPALELSYFQPWESVPYLRFRLIQREGKMLLLQFGSINKKMLFSPVAERYFASVELLESTSQLTEWSSAEAACQLLLPSNATFSEKRANDDTGNEYHIKMMQGTIGEDTYLFRYNDLPKGLYLESDSITLWQYYYQFKRRYPKARTTTQVFKYRDYPALDFRLELDEGYIRGMAVLRGQRFYLLLAISRTADGQDGFFDSFEFLPYRPIDYQTFHVADGSIQIRLPADTLARVTERTINQLTNQEDISDLGKEHVVGATDPQTGTLFTFESTRYSPLFQFNGETPYDSLLLLIASNLEETWEGKILWSAFDVLLQGPRVLDFVVQPHQSHLQLRFRLFLHNNYLYAFYAHLAPELVNDERIATYFGNFQLQNPLSPHGGIFESKASLILERLLSDDPDQRAEAILAMDNQYFSATDDLPRIYQILSDRSDLPQAVELVLLEEFRYTSDQRSPEFLREYYRPEQDRETRIALLQSLLRLKSEKGTQYFLELLYRDGELRREEDLDFPLQQALVDSLALFETYYPALKKLAENPVYATVLFLMGASVLEDAELSSQYLRQDLDYLHQRVERAIADRGATQVYLLEEILDFYRRLEPAPQRQVQMRRIFEHPDLRSWGRWAMVEYFAENGIAIQKEWVTPLLDDSIYIYPTLELLNNHQLQSLVADRYFRPDYLAEQMLYYYAVDVSRYPPRVRVIGKRQYPYLGKDQTVYLLQFDFPEGVTDSEPTSVYWGIAGPFSGSGPDLQFSDDLVNWQGTPWDGNSKDPAIDEQIRKWIAEEEARAK